MPTGSELRDLRTGLRLAARALQARSVQERAQAIEAACRRLLAADQLDGLELRRALLRSTGLSAQGIEHGLQSTLRVFTGEALVALHAGRKPARTPGLAAVVLAGNVFSAAARPLLLPLLCGWPVLLKAASSDDAFPRALHRALAEIDPVLGAACAVVTFGREDRELRDALIEDVELLSIYGDDDTVAAFAAIRSDGTRLIAHGHGLGLAFVATSALADAALVHATAQAIARDVAAYDQRGCLSPHAVLVQRGAACDAQGFALRLAQALEACALDWPLGELPHEAAAAQVQWRGVAAVRGELHAHAGGAVSYWGAAPLRVSPGYRNVAVHECEDLAALRAWLAPLSLQLKALAVAGDAEREGLTGCAPYVCAAGAMQEPPLETWLDGLHPCEGL
ncbi:MAG TPA: acyl-CoA reductase [Polyangiales bacterium]|nr:acyl-CoA reductase [Polyangiales bacterium]